MADTGGDSGSRNGNSASSKLTVSYTGITVASGGASAKITSPKVTFYSTSGWSDSTNRVRCSGGAVTDETLATNTSFDGNPSTHTWYPTATSVTLQYGVEATANFRGEVAGISFYETDSNTDWYGLTLTVHYPKRAYSAPAIPVVSLTRVSDTAATITITGNQNSTTVDKYWQYVDWQLQTDAGSFAGGETGLAGTTTSRSITSGLSANHRYRVQARARNTNATGSFGQSGYIYTTPIAPTLEAVAWNTDYTAVVVEWANNANYSDIVEIERSIDGGSTWTSVQVVGTTTTYTDTSAGLLNPYTANIRYRLRCLTPVPVITSSYSPTLVVATRNDSAPDVPVVTLIRNSDTAATINISGNQTNPALGKYWQYIDWQLQTDAGVYGGGATGLAGTTTSISVNGLSANHRYRVQVRARNGGATGDYGQSGFIYTTPPTPSLNLVWNEEDSGVDLSWTHSATYISEVVIQRSINGGGIWQEVARVNGTLTIYTDEGAFNPYLADLRYRILLRTPPPAIYSATSSIKTITMPAAIYIGAKAVTWVYKGTVAAVQVYRGDKPIL